MPTASREERFARRILGGGLLADDDCGFVEEAAGAVLCASAGVTNPANAAKSDSTAALVDGNEEKQLRAAWQGSNMRASFTVIIKTSPANLNANCEIRSCVPVIERGPID
jgi:hypothetical protein